MKKILCVDDSKVSLLILEAMFELHQDEYEVISVTSANEAFSILQSESIDLILLDIMMPGIDGYEAASTINKDDNLKDIPIIFLTSKNDQGTIAKCFEVGGTDYMHKPLNKEELFVRINFHLEMQENRKIIEHEKALSQEVFDMQDNLILLSDGSNIIKMNKTAFEFFNIDTLEEFKSKYGCLCDFFIQKEEYFYLEKSKCSSVWLENLVDNTQNKECLVLINNEKTKKHNTFAIKVKKLNKKYLVSLTDITSLAEEYQENELVASLDGLTNISNRLKFNKEYEKTVDSIRPDENFSLLIFDIDEFKNVNDSYGHLVGDDVLIKLSALMKAHTRQSDVLARWGGEEFVILLRSVKMEKATEIAEYLRSIIEVEHFDEVNNITCSFGVSEYKNGDDLNSLFKRVDEALYEAKEKGRNIVCSVP